MSQQNKTDSNPSPKQSPTKLDSLSSNIESLTKQLQKRQIARKQKKIRKRDELNDLYDAIEQKSNVVVSKIEDLTRKPTIVISVAKILPEIPEGFPKNYHIQIVYEDVTVTGNQKFVDFDENIVDQRFILPLLSSQTAKLQIWVAEQQPSVYDRTILHLQSDISSALEDPNYTSQIPLETNPTLSISYRVQLQGIGFGAWLKNVRSLREAEEERRKLRKQTEVKMRETKERVEEKKRGFQRKFQEAGNGVKGARTKEYDLKGIQEILNILDD